MSRTMQRTSRALNMVRRVGGAGGLVTGGLVAPLAPSQSPSIGSGGTYYYGGTLTDLQVGATGTISIKIDAGLDFIWRATGVTIRLNEELTLASSVFPKGYVLPRRVISSGAAAASFGVQGCLTLGNFRGEYSFGTEQGQNIPIPLDEIAGNAEAPYFLPIPRRIPGNTSVAIKVYNDLQASTAFTLASAKVNAWYVLIGERITPQPNE